MNRKEIWFSLFKKHYLIVFITIAIIVGVGLVVILMYIKKDASTEITDLYKNWQTYRNEEYGFEFRYPENWKVAKNIFSLEPNLVFCPPSLIDPDSDVICKLKTDTTKPQYEEGMIYLGAYDSNLKPTNPKYHYLGSVNGKYYYLIFESDKQLIANQILSTFKSLEAVEKKSYIKVLSPNGAEELLIGNSYEINWKVVGLERENVSLGLNFPDHGSMFIAGPIPAHSEKYFWEVPANIPPGKYKISVNWPAEARMSQIKISDTSDAYFSIARGSHYQNQKVDETTDWQTYRNEEYGYKIKYSDDMFILETEFSSPVETDTRDIGILKLRKDYWNQYESTIFNPQISWIVNLNTNSINDECGDYSSEQGVVKEIISGKEFAVREIISSDDVGRGGAYQKTYNYKGDGRCFVIWTSIGLRTFKDNYPKLDDRLYQIRNILEETLKTFKIISTIESVTVESNKVTPISTTSPSPVFKPPIARVDSVTKQLLIEDKVKALVNGQPILRSDYQKLLAQRKVDQREHQKWLDNFSAEKRKIREQVMVPNKRSNYLLYRSQKAILLEGKLLEMAVLDELIGDELLMQEAERRGVALSGEVFDQKIFELLRKDVAEIIDAVKIHGYQGSASMDEVSGFFMGLRVASEEEMKEMKEYLASKGTLDLARLREGIRRYLSITNLLAYKSEPATIDGEEVRRGSFVAMKIVGGIGDSAVEVKKLLMKLRQDSLIETR